MKGRRSLFEVLSKAPQTQPQRGRRSSQGDRSKGFDVLTPVAEALTEEEAAAEIAAERAAREERARLKLEKREAKIARKKAKQAARAAARAEAAQAARQLVARFAAVGDGDQGNAPIVKIASGRLFLSLNTAACMVAAAGLCVMALGAFSLGRRSVGANGSGLPPAASLSDDSLEELVGKAASDDRKPAPRQPEERPDLSALLRPPHEAGSSARANQPASVSAAPPSATADAARLNYLVIQTFMVTRDRNSEDLRKDLEQVRRFLADHGVKTFARQLDRGFRLFAAGGIPPSREHAAERANLQRKIEQLGQLFRGSGGLYDFKGCFFMTAGQAKPGKPI